MMRAEPGVAWLAPLFESPTLMSSANEHKPQERQVFQTKGELLRHGNKALGGWTVCVFATFAHAMRRPASIPPPAVSLRHSVLACTPWTHQDAPPHTHTPLHCARNARAKRLGCAVGQSV